MSTEREPRPTPLEDLLTGRNLARLGLGLLLLGLVFLFRYSVEQGWIGPEARVGLGGLLGLSMLITGFALTQRRPLFARLLQGGGVAALYLTAFATYRVYALIDATAALVVLAAVSALAVALALREQAQALAVIGLAGAFAAPILIEGRIAGFPGDMGYLAVALAVGSLLYAVRPWNLVFMTVFVGGWSVVGTDFLRLALDFDRIAGAEVLFGVAAIWSGTFLVPLAVSLRRSADEIAGSVTPVAMTAVVPPVAFGMALLVGLEFAGETVWAAVAAALAAFHIGLRRLVTINRGREIVADMQLLPALIFLGAAASLVLEGDYLLMAMAGMGVGMLIAGGWLRLSALAIAGHLVTAVVASLTVVVATVEPPEAPPLVNGPALAHLTIVALAAAAALALPRSTLKWQPPLVPLYAAASYLGFLGWLGKELWWVDNGQGLVTAAWAAVGIAALVIGKALNRRAMLNVGLGTVLTSVGKLFIVDLSSVDAIWRILMFLGFGVVLLAVGYWLSTERIGSALGE